MAFLPNGKLTNATISAFEAKIGFRLPQDYRGFLEHYNGGRFTDCRQDIKADIISSVTCDNFFGLNLQQGLDLCFWHEEMRVELPLQSLLIGNESCGGFFLLCCDSKDAGVYFYDHSYSFPSSTDSGNTYLIAPSFEQLAELIRIPIG